MGDPHPDGLVIIRHVRGLRDWVVLIQMVLLLSGMYEG